MTSLLFLSLLGCGQIQDMIAGQGASKDTGSAPAGAGLSSGGGSSSGSAGGAADAAPRGPVEIGVRTTPAPTKLINAGSDSSLPPPPIALDATQCNDVTDGGEITSGCVTETLKCGQTVVGHTRGGVNKFDTKFWEAKRCWPATVQHDGGDERVYRFIGPETDQRVYFTLDTPCADLDLMVMRWTGDECPTNAQSVADCEAKVLSGSKREKVSVPARAGWEYMAVVEGSGDEEGPFALTVQCGPWR